jgi:hypothetical protein
MAAHLAAGLDAVDLIDNSAERNSGGFGWLSAERIQDVRGSAVAPSAPRTSMTAAAVIGTTTCPSRPRWRPWAWASAWAWAWARPRPAWRAVGTAPPGRRRRTSGNGHGAIRVRLFAGGRRHAGGAGRPAQAPVPCCCWILSW